MSLIRRNPNRELEQMFDRFNRFFSEASPFTGFGKESMTFADWSPAVDVQETPEAYVVSAELPDVKREDVKVTVDNGVLMLSGERRQEKEEKGKKFHRVERSFGRFERSFALPDAIDDQKITATFKDGMLHLMVPKTTQAKPATREIKIG